MDNCLMDNKTSIKETWINIVHELQDSICAAVEKVDGKATFLEDKWKRAEGGGGITRVIANGNVFEKGGVNTSIVCGEVTEAMRTQLKNIPYSEHPLQWWACGISIVLHPFNPMVPTVHCNYRMFIVSNAGKSATTPAPEDQEVCWFGGGTDLTPFYLIEEDAVHFHQTYKNVCDKFDTCFYSLFKKNCDDYFVNTHRNNERRGIGGIFYDYQKPIEGKDENYWMDFGKQCGRAFITAYLPIVEKRKDSPFTALHKHWQDIRRGRYVEFNLVHDRGTIFGLKTNGRTESILMSLPPTVRFEYNYKPEPGSEENKLLQACLHPKDWLSPAVSEEEKNEWASRSNTC